MHFFCPFCLGLPLRRERRRRHGPLATPFTRCTKQANGTIEEAACYGAERTRLEREHASLMKTVAQRLGKPGADGTDFPAATKALQKAQLAWNAYLAADCEIVDHVFGNGTAFALARNNASSISTGAGTPC